MSDLLGLTEFSKKLDNSKTYRIFQIIFGIFALASGLESIWPLFIGAAALALGVHGLYKISKRSKPMCEYCGYVALDDRELHNYQINCEKKK